jgi:hypothetical protein
LRCLLNLLAEVVEMSIYTPLKWQESIGYRVNPDRCRASVHESGRGVGFHQCGRKPTVTREVNGKEYGFCKQHDPQAVAAARAIRDAKYKAESDARNAAWALAARQRTALPMLVEAMKTIAAGHNDARGLALETLDKIGDVA